jgi:hypothetical protein
MGCLVVHLYQHFSHRFFPGNACKVSGRMGQTPIKGAVEYHTGPILSRRFCTGDKPAFPRMEMPEFLYPTKRAIAPSDPEPGGSIYEEILGTISQRHPVRSIAFCLPSQKEYNFREWWVENNYLRKLNVARQ